MAYPGGSLERLLLEGDPDALAQVVRWIAEVLAAAWFRRLRGDCPDLHQEVLARVVASLRLGRCEAGRDFRTYGQAVARYAALGELAMRPRRAATSARQDFPDAEGRIASAWRPT